MHLRRKFGRTYRFFDLYKKLRYHKFNLPCRALTNAGHGGMAEDEEILSRTPDVEKHTRPRGQCENTLKIPQPEFDFEYLCDPMNRDEIHRNIVNRKGVGSIDNVVKLWSKNQEQISEKRSSEEHDSTLEKLYEETSKIPNRTHPNVPIGDETRNNLIELVGEKRVFNFKPKTTIELGGKLDMVRTDNLTMSAGHRSYYFTDGFAKLEQALIKYTLATLMQLGFELMSVPDLVHPTIIEGCGFHVRGDRTQVYRLIKQQSEVCLAGTGEVPIAGHFMNKQLTADELPKKVCTVSRCYRAEAPDTDGEGIYRVHQFTKVEMFLLCMDKSDEILKELIYIQRDLFAKMGLHCRILDMASHELGAPAHRKYDIEAWMPARETWGEISSASNCIDFQSRRLNIKYVTCDGKTFHVHTLNGTACAIPRTIMALVENYQNEDGTVDIPTVLQPYMGGLTQLVRRANAPKFKWIKVDRNYKKKMKEQMEVARSG